MTDEQPERPRVYLAGPDVFLPDATSVGAAKVQRAAAFGLEGVFPADNGLDLEGLAPGEQARRIALTNEALIRSCNAVVANLTPFRGVSLDAGTAFEVGFARALPLPVVGYTTAAGDYASRVRHMRADHPDVEGLLGSGSAVEDFDLAENLMIAIAIDETGLPIVIGDETTRDGIAGADAFDRCLQWIARSFSG